MAENRFELRPRLEGDMALVDMLAFAINTGAPDWEVSIDRAHMLLLFGAVVSAKPQNALELGIGMGYATRAILLGLKYNGVGTLTAVDSCLDFLYNEPPHFNDLRTLGAEIVLEKEAAFIQRQPSETFDLLVSDADHRNSHRWIDETIRIVKPGGLMFFHDTDLEYPGLQELKQRLAQLGMALTSFNRSSRSYERCERGWTMAVKPSLVAASTNI